MTTAASASTAEAITSNIGHPLPPNVRLLPGRDCWWVIRDTTIARLPREAVTSASAQSVILPEAYDALRQQGFFTVRPADVYAVTVLTATACNLGCAYCYQNTSLPQEGSFAPPRIDKAVLTSSRVGEVAAFIERQMARFDLKKSSLLLFGGEPLLNPSGALQMLQAMRPLGLADAEMITNAVLLTPKLATRLAEAGLRRAQITFDGGKDDHDSIRVTRNGRGTYDTILRNVIEGSAQTDLHWHFRVNISHRNMGDLERLIDDLGDAVPQGRSSLHLALIDDTGLGYDNTVDYSSDYVELFTQLVTRAVRHGMFVPISKPISSCPYCGVFGGDRGAVINADGKLYSCWETVGREDWIIGDVENGYLPEEHVRPRWVACDYDIKSHGTKEQAQRFFDQIDAVALDEMYACHNQVLTMR